MDELTREQEEVVAATVGAIQRIAMAIVELPNRRTNGALRHGETEIGGGNDGSRHRRCHGAYVAEQHDARHRVAGQRD